MIDKDLLRRIRNDLPMPITIAALGRDGPPTKRRDGRLFFLCPNCRDMQATVNPRNNLAHCFHCHQNLNNIDLLMQLGYDFATAVTILTGWLERHQSRLPNPHTTPLAK
jgi:DNA primase